MKAQVRIRSCGSADICAELRGPLRASRHQALRLPLLREDGLELTEVAPGIDSEADILSRLPFSATAFDPKPMNGALFRTALARFRGRIRDIGIDRRISCNAQTNTPFLDYSGMRVISESDLEKISGVRRRHPGPPSAGSSRSSTTTRSGWIPRLPTSIWI